MLDRADFVPLIPLTLLSVIKWFRDRYLYNRSQDAWWKASRVQVQVLLFLYPVWIFLVWSLGIQYQVNIGYALISTTGMQIVEHLTATGLLNDSFLQTKQQIVSSVFGLMIAYTWTVYNYMAISIGSEESNVEANGTECQCNTSN